MLGDTMKDIVIAKIPNPAIEYNGAVRLGAYTPPFPPVRVLPTDLVHSGNVRMGSYSPAFPATDAK